MVRNRTFFFPKSFVFFTNVSKLSFCFSVSALYPSTRVACSVHALVGYFVNVVLLGLGICHVIAALEAHWRAVLTRTPSTFSATGAGGRLQSNASGRVPRHPSSLAYDMRTFLKEESSRASFLM
jgi:hypothetical protein